MRVHRLSLGMGCAYLLEHGSGLTLVDAGSPGVERVVLRLLENLRRDGLRLIYITHAHLDHYGCAAALRRLTGAKIAIHQADAQAMTDGETHLGLTRGRGRVVQHLFPLIGKLLRPEPTPPDITLEDGQDLSELGLPARVVQYLFPLIGKLLHPEPTPPDITLEDGQDLSASGLPARVVHTPGHTPGSTCLWVEEGRLAFAGDLVSTTGGPHVQPYYACDWSLIPASLERLKALHPDKVYPGHGANFLDGEMLQLLRS